ncbi:MAG: ABC transporter ATP-binding protein [Treponema sp.]|nr:ABC transporter ATP-binding protein [Treponema sp.]
MEPFNLEISGLKKHFREQEALRGVDMSIPCGQIVGLLGPNASGKTTLLKVIAGLLEPTEGRITYSGNKGPGPEARQTIGFCPDAMGYPGRMRVRDAFAFFKAMYSDFSEERSEEIIDIMELRNLMDAKISRLSKGMKERLSFALTFSRDTKLYLLDEPLDGIDPVGKMQLIQAIVAMKPDNSSALISTHLVKDIERVLDSVYFLSRGKIVFSGSCDDIREEGGKTVEQAYLEVFTREGTI